MGAVSSRGPAADLVRYANAPHAPARTGNQADASSASERSAKRPAVASTRRPTTSKCCRHDRSRGGAWLGGSRQGTQKAPGREQTHRELSAFSASNLNLTAVGRETNRGFP